LHRLRDYGDRRPSLLSEADISGALTGRFVRIVDQHGVWTPPRKMYSIMQSRLLLALKGAVTALIFGVIYQAMNYYFGWWGAPVTILIFLASVFVSYWLKR